MMQQEITKILWNQPAGASVFRLGLGCGGAYAAAVPGQFVTLRLPGESAPLLRRPFSIHRLIFEDAGVKGIEILYKTVGEFTRKLSHASAQDPIDVLGPLGQGFTTSPAIKSAVLVAGGIGVAPMVFLAQRLVHAGAAPSRTAVCLGGRSAADILCQADFQAMDLQTWISSEDGSIGEKGLVTDGLRAWLDRNQPDMIYACGPMPMLRAVSDIAAHHELPCEVSLETIMACGVGACLGCAVKDSHHPEGYGHVCIDGPVFKASQL